jgi:Nucleotidyl transferase AbiEii toxin, Type IV TA system
VPTATLAEIYVDKVFALAARRYLKPRDVFDLHWLHQKHGFAVCSAANLQVRLATYPNETPSNWLAKAATRRLELKKSSDAIARELKRWLPSAWPLNRSNVDEMIDVAVTALDQGVEIMQTIAANVGDSGGERR